MPRGNAPKGHTEHLQPLADETARARAKFPSSKMLFAALAEEVGELGNAALFESTDRIRAEALQVANVAWRIYSEDFDLRSESQDLLIKMGSLEIPARHFLDPECSKSFATLHAPPEA